MTRLPDLSGSSHSMDLVMDGRIIPCTTFAIDQGVGKMITLRVEGDEWGPALQDFYQGAVTLTHNVPIAVVIDGEVKFKGKGGIAAMHAEPDGWVLEFYLSPSEFLFA